MAAIRELVDVMTRMDDVAFDAARTVVPLLAVHAGDCRKAMIGDVELEPHPDHFKADIVSRTLNEVLEKVGNEHGIFDLAQDNGMRVLTIKLLLNLGICVGRGGNDLFDESGTEYELKTLNLDNATLGVTTSHHLKHQTIDRYRKVGFIIAAYRRGRLVSVYLLHPEALEGQFLKWEASLERSSNHLNNPLIPISIVRDSGVLVFGEPLPKGKPKKIKNQMEMCIGEMQDTFVRQSFSSLESGMAASLDKSRAIARVAQEKAEETARRNSRAQMEQSELPF
ncbi:hypothetical protein G6L37_02465 [Agrobacterium rubi]|nr:hypothetical protein [Agrobacterium rubi]NTF24259.1 hypothetical protein [Agrobacterium rubi]